MNDQVLNLFNRYKEEEEKILDSLRISSANEWTDNNFNDGISNKAGWNNKLRAFGRFNGSGSRHFKIRSYSKKKD
jgi:hypothetical protein